jgi:transcriptional regulator with XRE-family HTH domain
MGELKKLAFKFREWLEQCRQVLDQNNSQGGILPDFPAEQFLKELSAAAANDKKAGIDPEPTLTSLAAIIRRHDRRMARDVEIYSSNRSSVTVNRMKLLKQGYLGRLEAGILELLCKAGVANTLSRLRDSQEISLRQLEQRSRVSFSYLSQIERLSGSLPSSEILSSLDIALLSPSSANTAPGLSLLRQRGDYDTAVQLVQQEEALIVNTWLQLMGGAVSYAAVAKINPVVRESGESHSGTPGSNLKPDKMLPFASSDILDDEYEATEAGEDIDEGGYAGSDEGDSAAAPANMHLAETGISTFELCDYFVELTPGTQKAVLRLVKDLARAQKRGNR